MQLMQRCILGECSQLSCYLGPDWRYWSCLRNQKRKDPRQIYAGIVLLGWDEGWDCWEASWWTSLMGVRIERKGNKHHPREGTFLFYSCQRFLNDEWWAEVETDCGVGSAIMEAGPIKSDQTRYTHTICNKSMAIAGHSARTIYLQSSNVLRPTRPRRGASRRLHAAGRVPRACLISWPTRRRRWQPRRSSNYMGITCVEGLGGQPAWGLGLSDLVSAAKANRLNLGLHRSRGISSTCIYTLASG